ncbi:MAG: hypothetical protein HAW59_04380, partial [Betaproteobacteria bacterium]|nr:hypothetical protein [Betaproteobacteria bacterium]
MRRRQKKQGQRKWALAALSAAVLFVGGMATLVAPWNAGKYHRETFCPKNGEYARTAVLIDATDSLSAAQTKAVADKTNALRGRLKLHEWLGVFVLNEDNLTLPQPNIALCNPGNEDTCNPLVVNCEDARLRFNNEFAAPMAAAVQDLAELPPRAVSPILEMIRAVALDRNFDSSQKRRLIIISDMLQNVPEYSHYKNGADFSIWKKTGYAREFLQLPLTGVEVEIWY